MHALVTRNQGRQWASIMSSATKLLPGSSVAILLQLSRGGMFDFAKETPRRVFPLPQWLQNVTEDMGKLLKHLEAQDFRVFEPTTLAPQNSDAIGRQPAINVLC